MSTTFRAWDIDQSWMLPPSAHEFVPAAHVAHFIRDTVRETLELSAILSAYGEERGYAPYHPGMMVALLLYGYNRSIYSSRQLARACEERVDFMALTGLNQPDFRAISEFRRRHLAALSALFLQMLLLCREAGLVRLGHSRSTGPSCAPTPRRHKAMSYGRMQQAETRLAAEVAGWLGRTERADAVEEAEHGADRRGDKMPGWVADKQQHVAWIRGARAGLEAEAAQLRSDLDPDGSGPSSGMQKGARDMARPDGLRGLTARPLAAATTAPRGPPPSHLVSAFATTNGWCSARKRWPANSMD